MKGHDFHNMDFFSSKYFSIIEAFEHDLPKEVFAEFEIIVYLSRESYCDLTKYISVPLECELGSKYTLYGYKMSLDNFATGTYFNPVLQKKGVL